MFAMRSGNVDFVNFCIWYGQSILGHKRAYVNWVVPVEYGWGRMKSDGHRQMGWSAGCMSCSKPGLLRCIWGRVRIHGGEDQANTPN